MPSEIPVDFYNGSNYDYHFIIKESVNEFEGQFECLGENTEKYKTSSVPIEKDIDSTRIMASSLSNLVDNLTRGIYKIRCKYCDCFLAHESVKDNLIKYKC